MKRREFLVVPVGAMSAVFLERLARYGVKPNEENGTVQVPLRFFTAAEARVVTAACERIFPADDKTPGATDAGVVVYIDRQLAGPYGRDAYRYTKGPFVESIREHGYQRQPTPRDVYRAGIRALGDFTSLGVGDQIAKLTEIESTDFFSLLRAHTIEGMFSDPVHGGNANLVGWRMIGFPGPQMGYRDEIDKHFGQAFRPKPASLRQITGRAPTPWEDEAS